MLKHYILNLHKWKIANLKCESSCKYFIKLLAHTHIISRERGSTFQPSNIYKEYNRTYPNTLPHPIYKTLVRIQLSANKRQ